jgi:hypothetical protein
LKGVQGGFFFGKKPLEYVLSVYTNPENAIDQLPHLFDSRKRRRGPLRLSSGSFLFNSCSFGSPGEWRLGREKRMG